MGFLVLCHMFQVNFAAGFVAAPGKADIQAVADHIEHIANIAGKAQYVSQSKTDKPSISKSGATAIYSVGIGSDFDGIEETPVGLEDVSKYPDLVKDAFISLRRVCGIPKV